MKVNLSRFLEAFDDIAYHFKYEKHLDYVSNSLSWCFMRELSKIDADDEKDLVNQVYRCIFNSLKESKSDFDHLRSEENAEELTNRAIAELRKNFEYYTTHLIYGKYPFSKYYEGEDPLNLSSFIEVSDPDEWCDCPTCGLKPIIWTWDNGAIARCGCEKPIRAESLNSVYTRTGKTYYAEAKCNLTDDALRYNWNHFCETGEDLFKKLKEENPKVW